MEKKVKKSLKIPKTGIIKNYKWIPILDLKEASYLVQRVYSASNNDYERKVFMTILRRAYDDYRPIEILYNEIPGVFKGDLQSKRNFRTILNLARSNVRNINTKGARGDLKMLGSSKFSPCSPSLLINPSKIMLILDALIHITHRDPHIYPEYVNTILNLWRQSSHLEQINQLARLGVDSNGRDRLAEHLGIIANNGEIEHLPESVPFQDRFRNHSSLPRNQEDSLPNPLFIPQMGDLWPPPSGGSFNWPPNDLPPPDLGPDPCEIIMEACGVIMGVYMESVGDTFGGFFFSYAGHAYADDITSIDPNFACAGNTIKILGSNFGATQPEDVYVLFGNMFAEVVSWSDSEIVVVVPDGAKRGCVGFLRMYSVGERNNLSKNRQSPSYGRLLNFCIGGTVIPDPIVIVPVVPCIDGNNYFKGTVPEINYFNISGYYGSLVNTPTPITLNWIVHMPNFRDVYTVEEDGTITSVFPLTIELRRISNIGPHIDGDFPIEGTQYLGIFDGPQGAVAEYELAAVNDCAIIKETRKITFGVRPNIAILGIEVIQTIQYYDLTNPNASTNNSVRLVAEKRTAVRVYIDSGLTSDPFLQPNVTGTLDLIAPSSLISEIRGITPFNAGGEVTARPTNQMDRNDLCHSLNFELPYSSLKKNVQLIVDVWVKGHEDTYPYPFGDDSWRARQTIDLFFNERRGRIVVRMLIRDGRKNIAAPTVGQYNTSLQGARTRFPVKEVDGFIIHIAPGFETFTTNRNLDTHDGWIDLLDDIDEIADEHKDWNQIWTGLVPDEATYEWGGYAIEGGEYPRLVSRAALPGTFAHELGHIFGIDHADSSACGETPLNIDTSLPDSTEDIGMDVAQKQLIPAGTSELMSYCTPDWTGLTSCGNAYPNATRQDIWPSVVVWNRIFNKLFILPFL